MTNLGWISATVATLFFCGAGAHARMTHEVYEASVKKMEIPFGADEAVFPYITDAQLKVIKKTIEKERQPAQVDKVAASSELDALVNELLAIRAASSSPEDRVKANDKLDQFLETIDNKYKQNKFENSDTKLFASQIAPLRILRGVVWKMIPVFEAENAKLTHTAVLTGFKEMSAFLRMSNPDEKHWKTGFDYVTMPYVVTTASGATVAAEPFKHESEVQGFIIYKVYETLKLAKDRLLQIDVSKAPVVWDNQVIFGPTSFKDAAGRYKRVGELEKQLLLAEHFFTLSQIAFLRSYSLNGALSLSAKMGKAYGFDHVLSSVEGVTHADRAKIIRDSGLKVGQGFAGRVNSMNVSHIHFKNAVKALSLAWEQSKNRPGGAGWLFNTNFIKVDTVFGDKKLATLEKALSGPVNIRNDLTGETAQIDLNGFFTRPPDNLYDLDAIPPFFDQDGPEMISITMKDSKHPLNKAAPFRNYLKGSPANWNVSKFNNVFPLVKTNQDLERSMRVFHHTFASVSHISLTAPSAQ